MIEYKKGNLLEVEAEAIVNSVNCVGVMGRGIALQFKKAWPDNFKFYADACRRGEVQPGKLLVFETGRQMPRYIINFPTKRHWRGKARMEDIEAGLDALAAEIRCRKIRSLALPPLGCGLGGLKWEEVRSRIEQILGGLTDVHIIVFMPLETAVLLPRSMRRGKVPQMTPGRAALVGLMKRYIEGFLDPFVSLLELHKLMYFMQEAGEPLRLRFVKGPYGPYAENLRHVLNAIEGYYISGYGSGGDAPDKVLELVPGAVQDAERLLAQNQSTRERFERVSRLIEGFESPHGLELLSTVHWIATRERPETVDELVERFYDWNPRKQRFSRRQILLACKVLKEHGWIELSPLQ
jgi:O-acetyl-ADP-ribose deacetylase (regulator of RNase III)